MSPLTSSGKKGLFPTILLAGIILIASVSMTIFLIGSQHSIDILFTNIETQYQQGLINIVTVARNAIEPILAQVRTGELDREGALARIRPLVRRMTYVDRDGNNYVFMSSYEGIMLVQPFEPSKESTSQIDLQDINGLYIIRELIKAAQAHPEGSFVRYHYLRPSPTGDIQEKLAYVMGLPEINCYIGTGMYMERMILEQKEILRKIKHSFLWLLGAVLAPIGFSLFLIYARHGQLLEEIGIRRKVEEELKKSENKYRSIFENAVEGVFQTTPGGRLLSANPALAHIAGYGSPQDMIDNVPNISNVYYDTSERNIILSTLNEKGFVQDYITRLKRKDGIPIWVTINCRSVKDEGGTILYYEGSIEDISEKRDAAERSRLSEEKFSKVFMMAPEMIAITRADDGLIVDINIGFEEMIGWKREEAIGKTSIDINFWSDPSARAEMVRDLEANRDISNREIRFSRKDGTEGTGIYAARMINVSDIPHIIFVMQDITENRKLEEERWKLEKQLSHSQKMDAIGQLAGGVAHDFNNILMGIQGNISLLMIESEHNEQTFHRLNQIEEHIRRGADLTKQLLGFAREGKYELKSLSVNDLLRKSAAFYMEAKKEIETSLQLQEDLPLVEADAGQMEQVFLNILINAGHAMPTGGRLLIQTSKVYISEQDAAVYQVSPGEYVKIAITDTGMGMEESVLKRIFEPFFTTKSHEGGTGLGLASAYGIVRNHKGAINAYSEPSKGSTFNIYLPAARATTGTEKERRPLPQPVQGEGTILIIDDEVSILNLGAEYLSLLGYSVYKAENLEEAVSIFETVRGIDLVILDMILKGTSGSEVLKRLKSIDPGTKVILSSGYSLQGEVRSVMEMGCKGFIQKPYNFTQLSRIVHDVISE